MGENMSHHANSSSNSNLTFRPEKRKYYFIYKIILII